ncbi:ankyrin [Hypoxylon cercidicola]|nr:ankyrin [Hypoxylon cercidicola]
MEVVGSVASIIQLISVTAKVVNYCVQVADAPQKVDELGREASMMLQLLYQVKSVIARRQVNSGASSTRGHPSGSDVLARDLEASMVNLAQQFEKLRPRDFKSRIRFTLIEKDVEKTIERASRMNGFLNSWLTLDIKQTTEDIDDGVRALNSHAEEEIINEKINRIVEHYAPVSFSEKHRNVLQQRQDGTGRWFLDSGEFQDWLESAGGTLWCSGAPGAGKTVMASIIIEHLQETVHSKENNGLAFLYCDYRQRHDQKARTLLGNLWAQLFRGRGPSATEVEEILGEVVSRPDSTPTRSHIMNLIRDEITNGNMERVYIVIDALDECSDENERNLFIDSLHSLQPLVNVLVTSRTTHLDNGEFNNVRSVRFTPSTEDMSSYISSRIRESKKLTGYVERRRELEEEIRRVVVDRANGMFLLCRMHLDALSKAITLRDVKRQLDRIPQGENILKDTYDFAMERIRDQGVDIESFALQVIRWICFARRPLKLAELLSALAVSPGDTELDEDAVGEESDIANYCAGLVVVEGESKTVRFVHYTTQEYFNTLRDTDEFIHSHRDIALMCITFLGLDKLSLSKDGYIAQIWPSQEEAPFFVYAALNFGFHYNQEKRVSGSQDVASLRIITDSLLEFLENLEHVERAGKTILLNIHGRTSSLFRDDSIVQKFPIKASATDLAAFYNVICNDSDHPDQSGVSLEWLVKYTEQVKDPQGLRFGNPLHWAGFDNSVESIEVLLHSPRVTLDVRLSIVHPLGWPPSAASVAYGSLDTLKALLNYGIDIYQTSQNEWHPTLLQEAISHAHAVKGPDKAALINAIMEKDTAGKLLLGRDVYMSTALIEAVRTADFGVFECVMGHYQKAQWPPGLKDQAILTGDRELRTALHWAVSDSSLSFRNADRSSTSGPLRILEALLDNPHANGFLQKRNSKGDSPFEAAIRRNNIQAVDTIFTKHEEHRFDNFYPTQVLSGLNLAARVAEPPMLTLLLSKINHDLLKHPGNDTVLHHAVSGNRPGNTEFLLRKLESLRLYNARGSRGNSALHHAAASGNEDAVNTLLEQDGIDINAQNQFGQTALHLAIHSNLTDMCVCLLEAGADISVKAQSGFTPPVLAVKKRLPEVAAAFAYHSSANFNNLEANDIVWVQQQPWGHIVLQKPDNPSKLVLHPEYWPKDEEDIIQAALCLQRKLTRRLPSTENSSQRSHIAARLISRILDLAEYWIRSTSVRVDLNERGEVRRWGEPLTPYIMSRVIAGRSPQPVRRVVFEITSHDQGYCSNPERGNSWTWFTADVHRRENSTLSKQLAGLQDQGNANREIYLVHNRGADREWFTHKLSWSLADTIAASSERTSWITALSPGDRIVVVPHARYPGWENWVRRVKIDVFTTCLRGHDDYASGTF